MSIDQDGEEFRLLWQAETAMAYGVKEHGEGPLIWLPKSQCDVDEAAELGQVAMFLIPEWLAIEKGLV